MIFNSKTKIPPIDFEAMERELTSTPIPHHETPLPPAPTLYEMPQHTAVQIIAHGITQLRWKDAEAVGAAIQAKFKDGLSLTAAIQAWAEEWESFT